MEGRLFEDLVVSRGGGGRMRAGGMPFSLLLHAAGLTGLVAFSLVVTEQLPTPPNARIPLPGPHRAVVSTIAPPASSARPTPPRRRSITHLLVQTDEPQRIEPEPFTPDADDDPGCLGCAVGAEGPDPSSVGEGSVGDGIGDTRATGPNTVPVRVGGHIQAPRKIRHVAPAYPDLARRASVAGVVVLECVIDRDGFVQSVQVWSGHPLLNEAAVVAVRQWAYRPTLLNGVPVAVVMTVTVRFTTR